MAEDKKSDELNYEEGKQVEDYLKDLSAVEETIKIEPEPHPEAMVRMEDVAQPPIRNKPEKKSEAKKQSPPPEAPKPTPTVPQPIVSQPVQPTPIPQVQTSPPETLPKPIEQLPTPQPVVQPKIVGVDEFIETMSRQEANKRYNEVKSNVYRNIDALFKGDLILVPPQQLQQMQQQTPPPQPAPQPEVPKEPVVEVPPQASVMQQVETLEKALANPSIALPTKRAIKKKQCDLLGIPFDESMMTEVSTPQSVQPASPVNPKLVDDGKKKKRPLKLKEKAMIAAVGTAVVVLIIITASYLIH